MTPVKRILVLILTFAFLINCMGYYIFFGIRQNLIRSEMFQSIRKGTFHEEVVCFRIIHPENYPGFKRVDKNEFILDGVYYDVIVEHQSGNTTCFYCLHDRKEESLIKYYETCMFRHKSQGEQQKLPLQALYQNFISEALVQLNPDTGIYPGLSVFFADLITSTSRGFISGHSPPPKFL